MMNKFAFLILFLFSSCYRVSDKIEPHVDCLVQEGRFAELHSAFSPLNSEEKSIDWGKEMLIAHAFARDWDLYRAVSTYKRAEILIEDASQDRKTEIQYDILLCYYLGKHYDEAIESVDKSLLANVDKTFPAYHDLLLILYECYHEVKDVEKEEQIYERIQKDFPETAEKLKVSSALRDADLSQVQEVSETKPQFSYVNDFLCCYAQQKKSVRTAQVLNATIPGAGYLYLGQKRSALTAFFLNGLFIAAAYEFFHHDHLAAGIITTSFETGWYFGGIYGAGEEAKYYNEKVYERNAHYLLNEHALFPALMIKYAF